MNNRSHARMRLIAVALLFATAIALTEPVYAHHSSAGFDMKQTVSITGVITRYYWANPHVYVYFEETTDAGKKVEWEVECLPHMALRPMGWLKETLRVGETITVIGNPAKNATNKELYPATIKRGDSTLFSAQYLSRGLSSPGAPPSFATNSLYGIWSTTLSMQLMIESANPDVSKLTKQGAEARKIFDEKTGPSANCIAFPAPLMMIAPDLKRITLGDGVIYIEGEYEGTRRTIYMNAPTRVGAIPSFQGHSIGKWEGKSLVIDSTHFAFHAMGNGGGGPFLGVPSGMQKHLIERFTPSADGKSLTYHFELTDPEFLAAPRMGELQWTFSPNKQFETDKCSLESARRFIKN